MRCVCVLYFSLRYFFNAVFYRMCAVVSFVLPILETLAARCALPALFYLREVAEDGSVLAGVELELPMDGSSTVSERKIFWSGVSRSCMDAYDQAAMQAIRFLQGMYGFVIRDYNYDCMVAYRDSMRSAIVVASCIARRTGRLEREVDHPLLGPTGRHVPLDWLLLCSRLMASLRYV